MNRKNSILTLSFFTLFLLVSSVSAALDTSKVGVAIGDKFTYESKTYFKGVPDFQDDYFGNGTTTVEILSLPNSSHIADVKYTFPNGTTEVGPINMSTLGYIAIYNDWEYWQSNEAFLGIFDTVTDKGDAIEFSHSFDDFGFSFFYLVRYQKSNGVMEFLNSTSSSSEVFLSTIITLTSSETSGNNSLPGFELVTMVTLPAIAVIISRKRKEK